VFGDRHSGAYLHKFGWTKGLGTRRSRARRPRTIPPWPNSFVPRGNNRDTSGAAASRTWAVSTSSSPSAVCRVRARNPLRMPRVGGGPALVARRPSHASNSSSTARWMINLAPSLASCDNAARGSTNANGQQLVDLSFDLRRRRSGTSHAQSASRSTPLPALQVDALIP
jgi:hypothetical protein